MFKEEIQYLHKLKEEIFSITRSSSTSQEFSMKLFELVSKDPDNTEIYQLILLLNSNFDTDQKNFKTNIAEVITQIINSRIKTLELLVGIVEKVDNVDKNVESTSYITIFKKKVAIHKAGFWLVLSFLTLSVLFKLDPDFMKEFIQFLKEVKLLLTT